MFTYYWKYEIWVWPFTIEGMIYLSAYCWMYAIGDWALTIEYMIFEFEYLLLKVTHFTLITYYWWYDSNLSIYSCWCITWVWRYDIWVWAHGKIFGNLSKLLKVWYFSLSTDYSKMVANIEYWLLKVYIINNNLSTYCDHSSDRQS